MLRTVSIMPGMDLRAPDRQDTRAGSGVSKFHAHVALDLDERLFHLGLENSRVFMPLAKYSTQHPS